MAGNVDAAFTVSAMPRRKSPGRCTTAGRPRPTRRVPLRNALHARGGAAEDRGDVSACVVQGTTTYTAQVRLRQQERGRGQRAARDGEPAWSRITFGGDQPIVFMPGVNPNALTITGIPNRTTVDVVPDHRRRHAVERRAGAGSPACSGSDRPRCRASAEADPRRSDVRRPGRDDLRGAFLVRQREHRAGHDRHRRGQPPEPGAEGQGPPTVFEPDGGAFAVTGIPNGTFLIWLVTYGGTTEQAQIGADFATTCSGPSPPDPPDPVEPPLPPDPPDPAGEPIGVFVDCVQDNGTTYDVVFGYQNQNEDAVRIPAGAGNGFRTTPPIAGQVTEFLPGNVQRAFAVEGIGRGTELHVGGHLRGRDALGDDEPALRDTVHGQPGGARADRHLRVHRRPRRDVRRPVRLRERQPGCGLAADRRPEPRRPRSGRIAASRSSSMPGRIANAFTVRGVPRPASSRGRSRTAAYAASSSPRRTGRLRRSRAGPFGAAVLPLHPTAPATRTSPSSVT